MAAKASITVFNLPATANPGDAIWGDLTIQNIGDATATMFASWYLNGGYIGNNRSIYAPGESKSFVVHFTMPNSNAVVRIDAGHQV